MARRLKRLPVSREPPACSTVQRRELVAKTPPQLGTHYLREERVVAEPGATRVERVHEAPRPLQLAQRMLGRGVAGQGFRELAVEAVHDRRTQQEELHVLRISADHFGHQVIAHRPVATREAGDERTWVGMALKR